MSEAGIVQAERKGKKGKSGPKAKPASYQLVFDPDTENGLLPPRHVLNLNYAEVSLLLNGAMFTVGSVILRGGRRYVVTQAGCYQTLQEQGG